MSRTKLIGYMTVCVIALVVLGFTFFKKFNHNQNAPVVFNLSPPKTQLEEPNLQIETPAVDVKEFSSWYVTEQMKSQKIYSGRIDPFALLAEEEASLAINEIENPASLGIIPQPGNSEASLDKTSWGYLRGIMYSKNPSALIENPDGLYRRVIVGDSLAGGNIAKINPDSLEINRNGQLVIIKMGEEQ